MMCRSVLGRSCCSRRERFPGQDGFVFVRPRTQPPEPLAVSFSIQLLHSASRKEAGSEVAARKSFGNQSKSRSPEVAGNRHLVSVSSPLAHHGGYDPANASDLFLH
jgi:hypothetical protein